LSARWMVDGSTFEAFPTAGNPRFDTDQRLDQYLLESAWGDLRSWRNRGLRDARLTGAWSAGPRAPGTRPQSSATEFSRGNYGCCFRNRKRGSCDFRHDILQFIQNAFAPYFILVIRNESIVMQVGDLNEPVAGGQRALPGVLPIRLLSTSNCLS